jgi:small-conductance mechanosensitive channel
MFWTTSVSICFSMRQIAFPTRRSPRTTAAPLSATRGIGMVPTLLQALASPPPCLTTTLGSDTVTLSNYSFVNSVFPDPIYASFDLTVSSSVAGTPEPSTFLLAAGVLGLAIKLRR